MNLARQLQFHGLHLPKRQRLQSSRLHRLLEPRQTLLVRLQLILDVVSGDVSLKRRFIRERSARVDALEPRELLLHLPYLHLLRGEFSGSQLSLPGAEPSLDILVFRRHLLVPVVEGIFRPGRRRLVSRRGRIGG